MTTPNLPEPVAYLWYARKKPAISKLAFSKTPAESLLNLGFTSEPLYTADQVREILEIAAKESDNLAPDPDQWSPKEEYTERRTARACAAAIRVLKEQL